MVKTIAMPSGWSIPPPSPCKARKAIRLGRFQAKPQRTEPKTKQARVIM
jgi:hypothetical protein